MCAPGSDTETCKCSRHDHATCVPRNPGKNTAIVLLSRITENARMGIRDGRRFDICIHAKSFNIILDKEMGFSRPKNLRDHLCSAKLTPLRSVGSIRGKVVRDNECNRPNNCMHCPKLNLTSRITSFANGCIYKIPSHVTCQSNNLIYTVL